MGEYDEILRQLDELKGEADDLDAKKTGKENKLTRDDIKAAVMEAMNEAEGNKRPTKEQIMSVKNRTERQKLIKENMDLFTN